MPLPRAGRLAERVTLAGLVVVTIAAVAGFAIFALHPERLASVPGGAASYGLAMVFFPRVHIALGLLAVACALGRVAGTRWLPAFAALYVASLVSELLGTTTGLPFGAYGYTDGLGAKWFGHVPVLIPASWFTMAVTSFALTRAWLGVRGTAATIAIASVCLVAWDLVLDPAMSRLTPYWVWAHEGPYYGMPLLNLVGWYVTGVALMGLLAASRSERWIDALPPDTVRALALVYAANLALPMALTLAAGLVGPALAATGALAALAVVAPVTRARLDLVGARR